MSGVQPGPFLREQGVSGRLAGSGRSQRKESSVSGELALSASTPSVRESMELRPRKFIPDRRLGLVRQLGPVLRRYVSTAFRGKEFTSSRGISIYTVSYSHG